MKPKPSLCCYCGHFIELATHPVDDTQEPTPGDLSMCIDCGGVLVFTEDMDLRGATAADLESLDEEERALLAAMKEGQKQLAKPPKPKRRAF